MGYVKAASKLGVAEGTICEAQVNGKTLALANVNGTFCATSNVCPHEGGPIGEGLLEGPVVTCPWHGWQFDVTSGKLVAEDRVGLETYPVKVEGDDILVDLG